MFKVTYDVLDFDKVEKMVQYFSATTSNKLNIFVDKKFKDVFAELLVTGKYNQEQDLSWENKNTASSTPQS